MQTRPEWQIMTVIDAIDNAVDAKDWAQARSYFTDIIYVDFSSLGGGKPAEIQADDLIAAWQTNLYAGKQSFHLRGSHAISINGETATDYSKGYAINTIDEGPVTGIWEIWANYSYTLVRAGDDWKVTGMSVYKVQTRGDDRIRAYVPGGE
jgi:hypothetical protein